MSLFQCGHCGCCENTALASQGCDGYAETFFDWAGFEDRKGKKLCSACAPTKHSDGSPTEFGAWHGRFTRVFLPMGLFRTARNGNLEHIETGDQEFRKFALATPEARTLLEPTDVQLFQDIHGHSPEQTALIEEAALEFPYPYREKLRDAMRNAWVGGYNEHMDEARTPSHPVGAPE